MASQHTFHIPVMGTGFTIDTPLKVARYGISSVISLVDDVLIEQMRKFHSEKSGEPYQEILNQDPDARAHRITAYLNLIHILVQRQVQNLKSSPFEPGSEITRYYEMLPESDLKQMYQRMGTTSDIHEKIQLQDLLRSLVAPGTIDVNIMTKVDRPRTSNGEPLPHEFSDAMSALRGFAKSSVESSIIFSAGMNQRLYSYAAQFEDFLPDENGTFKKQIILKVSDYRSAEIQGKFLAKRGLWVSEYRIESGLNCGGHAFATQGYLMGPILDEFKRRKGELIEKLKVIFWKALEDRKWRFLKRITHKVRITAQGGIGTFNEDQLLLKNFELDSTGWGTPFLLVPEVTCVDAANLQKLTLATESDVTLSNCSPLGVPFWTLRNSESEEARLRRIQENKPGSLCPKGFLASNSEFEGVPLCTASRVYQKLKLEQISKEPLPDAELSATRENIIAKSCICHDLGGGATINSGIDLNATTAICCGPNIVNFSKIATLEEMVGHIYGRLSLLRNSNRPHMFIKELELYVDYFRQEIKKSRNKVSTYFQDYLKNLLSGIEYYKKLARELKIEEQERFLNDLAKFHAEILKLTSEIPCNI